MNLEEIWPELELKSGVKNDPVGGFGWILRQISPVVSCPLNAAIERGTGRRALLLRIETKDLPAKQHWPRCRGLEVTATKEGENKVLFGVVLKHQQHGDVFSVLATDLIGRISAAKGPTLRVNALLNGIGTWQKFMTAAREELSLEAQRGLWGELFVLRNHLLPAVGPDLAVVGWKGSAAAHQDFQFASGALEVKTTAAKQPQTIRITSERQLDDTGVGALFLHVVMVDEREVAETTETPGRSLGALILELRNLLEGQAAALIRLNDCLLERGWLDAYAGRYESHRWTVRAEHTFHVRQGFPRLVELNLPTGVGDVNFAISLAACEPFAVPFAIVTQMLASNPTSPKPPHQNHQL
jgi:hypothetical protein